MRNFNERLVLGFVPFVVLLFALGASVPLYAQSDSRYGISEAKNVMVSMRAGVKLAADLYRPARNREPTDGKFPVILLRTPYDKENSTELATVFVPHGYVVVAQDVRGRYNSEGHWRPH